MNKIDRYLKYLIPILLFFGFSLSAKKVFKGKVVTLADEKLSEATNAYDRGWIKYTARLGEIVKPSVFNTKGEIVIPGDIVILGDPTAWEAYLKADKINLEASKKILDASKILYERYKKLSKKNAVSQQDFVDTKSAYAAAKGRYLNYITVLEEGKIAANRMDIRAPFEGIVKAVTHGFGSDVGGCKAVEIIKLNPIGIKINIPINEQRKYTHTASAKVYVEGMDKPIGICHLGAIVEDNSLMFAIQNYPVIEKNTLLNDNGLPVLRKWRPVVNFGYSSITNAQIGVPVRALQKDEKGTYVWKAKGQKVMQTDKGIDYTFPIEKIYIQPEDKFRYYSSSTKLVCLKDNGKLERHDLVLNQPPSGLKDGQKVIYPQQAYLLMPGDEVKVVIEE